MNAQVSKFPFGADRLRAELAGSGVCPQCLNYLRGWGLPHQLVPRGYTLCANCGYDAIQDLPSPLVIRTTASACPVCTASLVQCHNCGMQWCLDHSPNPLVCPQCGARE